MDELTYTQITYAPIYWRWNEATVARAFRPLRRESTRSCVSGQKM